jgi:hypothetical protein
MLLRVLVAVACLAFTGTTAGQGPTADATTALLTRLEQAVGTGKTDAVMELGLSSTTPGLRGFAAAATPTPTRFIIKERDRAALTSSVDRLLLEVFGQYGNESSITTWRMDVSPNPEDAGQRRIAEMEQLSVVSGLHRLALNPAKHFDVRNLKVQGTDLSLELPTGHAFVAETSEGPTAVVLLGRGRMRFSPSDPAERTQIRIFSGDELLETDFDAAFVRVRPAEFPQMFPAGSFTPRAVGQGEYRRASDIFDEYVGQTLHVDLTDLSRERWSLIPSPGDLIAEIRTRRLGSLTYARSSNDAEDISLFERRRRRNIAVYASPQKLASRGRFYSEDDLVEYDVQHYDVDAAFTPERMWIDGTVELRVRVRSYVLASMTLRLAEPLVVRSIVSPEYGRLLHLRVVGQNSVIVNFPGTVSRNAEFSLRVVYGGRLEPQQIDREGITVGQPSSQQVEEAFVPVEPQYIYSNRSYWYPQATVTDYASARLRISVPADHDVVASGTPAGLPTPTFVGIEAGQRARKVFVFEAERPVRYLGCVISRFQRILSRQVTIPLDDRRVTASGAGLDFASGRDRLDPAPESDANPEAPEEIVQARAPETAAVTLNVIANPRQAARARSLADRTAAIFLYYGSLVGDAPYPTFTLAVAENELPGGHSPPYFAVLNHPPPTIPMVWRNDPVAFDNYPSFFLAHELAHQWWGQGVGWKNYHEQWLSEGFAQYFAALYAVKDRGPELFTSVLRQMRRWAVDQSDQGPIHLGYRLGHIRGDGRIFRALVYNKGAMVLHMLRRLLGEEVFFAGLRQFYADWKFKKAGTDDVRVAMERASKRDLASFFDAWIYGTSVPSLGFSSTLTGNDAVIRFEHRGEILPVPVTVSIIYMDGQIEEVVVPVTEKTVERTLPLKGPVRSIEANRDHGALAEINR